MPPLHTPAAAGATSHRHIELPVDRPTRNLYLVLMIDMLVDELPPPATRTTLWQRGLMSLVDDRWHDAERLGSIVVAASASRPLGINLGQTA